MRVTHSMHSLGSQKTRPPKWPRHCRARSLPRRLRGGRRGKRADPLEDVLQVPHNVDSVRLALLKLRLHVYVARADPPPQPPPADLRQAGRQHAELSSPGCPLWWGWAAQAGSAVVKSAFAPRQHISTHPSPTPTPQPPPASAHQQQRGVGCVALARFSPQKPCIRVSLQSMRAQMHRHSAPYSRAPPIPSPAKPREPPPNPQPARAGRRMSGQAGTRTAGLRCGCGARCILLRMLCRHPGGELQLTVTYSKATACGAGKSGQG